MTSTRLGLIYEGIHDLMFSEQFVCSIKAPSQFFRNLFHCSDLSITLIAPLVM